PWTQLVTPVRTRSATLPRRTPHPHILNFVCWFMTCLLSACSCYALALTRLELGRHLLPDRHSDDVAGVRLSPPRPWLGRGKSASGVLLAVRKPERHYLPAEGWLLAWRRGLVPAGPAALVGLDVEDADRGYVGLRWLRDGRLLEEEIQG